MIHKNDIDIRLIGSDVSLKAIETATNNIEFSELDNLTKELIVPR